MKKLLYLFLLFPFFLFAQPRYGVEGIPMCWKIGSIDSNITRYVIISSTGSPVQTIAWENAAGQVINVSGGYLRYGYCDCAGSSGGGNGIYGGSGTLPNALVQVQNTQGIKFVEPGTQNGILIANKANGAAALALDPVYTDSIRQGLVWKQGADSAAVGIDKDGRLQLLSNNWVAIGNDQAKIIIRKDDAVVLIKTGNNVYGLADGVPLSGKNNVMLWPNGSASGRFANLDSLVDGRAKRDTFITVPPNTNYFQNIIDNPARFYNNIYLSCKGRTDTSIVAFVANPVFEEQKGVVYHIKNDSGLVAAFVINFYHLSNSKRLYLLQRGQIAQVRLLPDAANDGQYGWAVNVVWDSIGDGNGIISALPLGNVTIDAPNGLILKRGYFRAKTSTAVTGATLGGSGLFLRRTGTGPYDGPYIDITDTTGVIDNSFYWVQDNQGNIQNYGSGPQLVFTHNNTKISGQYAWSWGIRVDTTVTPAIIRHMYGNRYGGRQVFHFIGDNAGTSDAVFNFQPTSSGGKMAFNIGSAFNLRANGKIYFGADSLWSIVSGTILHNNPTTATSTSTKLFNELRQKWPGNASKWFSISDFYEARNTVAIRGFPTWYKLAQWNGGAGYEWANGIAFDSTNSVLNYSFGGRYSPSFLLMSIARPASGVAYQNVTGLDIGYLKGNGLSTSLVLNIHDTQGAGSSYFNIRQDGRVTFGNDNISNSYYFPVVAPSSTAGATSTLIWTANVPSFLRSQHAVTTGTTDGSGDLTITFVAAMPDATYTVLTQNEGTTAYILSAHTKATGSVKVRVFDAAGAAVTSTSVTISYEVKDY